MILIFKNDKQLFQNIHHQKWKGKDLEKPGKDIWRMIVQKPEELLKERVQLNLNSMIILGPKQMSLNC